MPFLVQLALSVFIVAYLCVLVKTFFAIVKVQPTGRFRREYRWYHTAIVKVIMLAFNVAMIVLMVWLLTLIW